MQVATITLNPALDKSSTIDKLVPEHKLRCTKPKYNPGGGGINISRAIKKLGGNSIACYFSGGTSGQMLEDLLMNEGIESKSLPINNPTRENFVVLETSHNHQYRFTLPGPEILENEWTTMLEFIKNLTPFPEFLVASGSIPQGIPTDFYAQLAKITRQNGSKLVLDTSGEPLSKALEEGVYLIKPNLKELSGLFSKTSITAIEQETLAQKLVNQGNVEVIIVSMGPRGAMVASREGLKYVIAPTVHSKSTVGAGDSMVAGTITGLMQQKPLIESVKYGVAAGTAATLQEGTELCDKTQTEQLFQWLMDQK